MTQPAGLPVHTDPLQCPLCSIMFARDEQLWSCQGCPLMTGCRLLRCPRCGYEWPAESRIVNWLTALWCKRPPVEHT